MSYELFITCKCFDKKGSTTRAGQIVSEICSALGAHGIQPFVSTEKTFSRDADTALAQAPVFLLVCTDKKDARDPRIKREWSAFAKKQKKTGVLKSKLIIALEGMNASQLPSGLQNKECYAFAQADAAKIAALVSSACSKA